jgi:hypothetical protein
VNEAPTLNTLTSGLAGWWKLDESSGASTADASGNGNNGTLTNMSGTEWTAGQRANALQFDGTNDYVSISDTDSLDITSSITIATWIRPTDVSGSRLF